MSNRKAKREEASRTVPSATEIFNEALKLSPDEDVNVLHEVAFALMINYRSKYYERRVNELLAELSLPSDVSERIKKKLLEPIQIRGKVYSNFMEEVSRRVSQAFQPIAGNLAELCAQRELEREGLKEGLHFERRKGRTDLILYYPDIKTCKVTHRVEVKNVSLRERGVRGLMFDGDSLFGFFNQPKEFTASTVEILDQQLRDKGGYCYIPPSTLSRIPYRLERFRLNTRFGKDMLGFQQKGFIA